MRTDTGPSDATIPPHVTSRVSRLRKAACGLLLCSICLGGLAISCRWMKLNVSASMPLGLYRLHSGRHELTRGSCVIVHVPGWSHPRRPFLKPVAAVAGDWVCRGQHRLGLHGQDYGIVHETWTGVTLPAVIPEGRCLQVPAGHVFLASRVPNSLDSRYFGMIPVAQIAATAAPLLTWRSAHAAPPD